MIKKTKSWTLLLVFSLSLVPFGVGQAEIPDRAFEEARQRMQEGQEQRSELEHQQDELQPTLNPDEFTSDDDACRPGDPWLTAVWEETVFPRLKEDGKHCFSSREYYS